MSTAEMELLHEPGQVLLALSPLRRRLLERLGTRPGSASQLAGEMGMPRQRVNYHLRALEQAGLVELVEERQRRGCTERLMAATARAFVIDPLVMGTAPGPAAVTAQDRFAAEHLVGVAAEVVRDVARMQTAAEGEGKRLLTFTIETEISFAEPADVERFTTALAKAVARTASTFNQATGGRRYRVVVGGHPAPKARGEDA